MLELRYQFIKRKLQREIAEYLVETNVKKSKKRCFDLKQNHPVKVLVSSSIDNMKMVTGF